MRTALAMLLVTMLAGCSRFFVDWDTRSIRTTPDVIAKPVAPAPAARNTSATSQRNATLHRHKRKPVVSTSDTKQTVIQPDTTETPPAPPPPSTISMATPGGSSDAAEKEIEAAGQRLARFDRNQLSRRSLATYDEANGLLSQGKQALAEKDFVAASGFAQKASVLADQLRAGETAQ